MEDVHIVQYTRSREESRKLYYKQYKKQILGLTIRAISLVPVSFIFGLILTVAIELLFNFDDKYYIVHGIWTILILYPFINPIIKTRRQVKTQLKETFELLTQIETTFTFSNNELEYKNDLYSFKTVWVNTKNILIEKELVTFQAINPSLQFSIPKEKLNQKQLEFLKSKIVKM